MKIRIEKHARYGKCRVGEGWAAAADIAHILGYVKGTDFANKHVAREDKRYEMIRALDTTNCSKTLLVNRKGVAAMLDACANVDADQIKEWMLSVMGEEKPVPTVLVPQVVEVQGVHGYLDDKGIAWLKVEDVARRLGFVDYQEKDSATSGRKTYEVIRWARVNEYLAELAAFLKGQGIEKPVPQNVGKDDFIPENVVYLLAMKANNEVAKTFQWKVADEILPAIRQKGFYSVKPLEEVEPAQIDEFKKQIAELQEQMAGLEILFQQWLEMSPVGQIEKLLGVADKLHEPDAQDKVLLQAVNLILGKKLF
ncbi:MAG: hypothetical protein IJP68_05845 [Selenomonadaceae bacterium]|nr:hypothetical protein [Selenomonadaceae bacterium]